MLGEAQASITQLTLCPAHHLALHAVNKSAQLVPLSVCVGGGAAHHQDKPDCT
jgi:hypothetical protein